MLFAIFAVVFLGGAGLDHFVVAHRQLRLGLNRFVIAAVFESFLEFFDGFDQYLFMVLEVLDSLKILIFIFLLLKIYERRFPIFGLDFFFEGVDCVLLILILALEGLNGLLLLIDLLLLVGNLDDLFCHLFGQLFLVLLVTPILLKLELILQLFLKF